MAHEGLFEQASCLFYHLIKNHPCTEGNKRVAVILTMTFLEMNGWIIDDPPGELFAKAVDVAESDPTDRAVKIAEMTNWLYLHRSLAGMVHSKPANGGS